ncbi:hypothetical protein T03_2091 [Trichinella britovi]|uniref:MBD domain-containing protein n=1 Tax=Trichinella britovi TaxID=45882 RepID=A0A0V1CU18_TRIBR|nr:hypothetical protein T03_2091 [Trichinella britovi]
MFTCIFGLFIEIEKETGCNNFHIVFAIFTLLIMCCNVNMGNVCKINRPFAERACRNMNTDKGDLSYECIKARHESGDTSIDGIIEELEFLLKDTETVKKQISESLGAPREVLEIYGLTLPEETAKTVDDQNLIQQLCLPGTSEQFITQEGVVRRKRKMRKKNMFKAAVNPAKRESSKKVKVRRRKALDIADLTPQQKEPYEKPELVLRALPSKSTSADVYYISPSGIKFRSSKEVERFAIMNPQSMNGLGPENFTFRRYLLGTGSPLEYKRDAGFRFGTKAKFARTMEVKIKIENPEIDDNDVNPNVVDSNPEDMTS